MDNEIKKAGVPNAVKSRLPRYYRHLRQLINEGKLRISSNELAKRMNVTSSQIRQDFNYFGGFGQQGYGYNVKLLFGKIGEILGIQDGFVSVVVGAGNLGRSIVTVARSKNRSNSVAALFDVSTEMIGRNVMGVPILSLEVFEEFCEREHIDIVSLTVPDGQAKSVAERIKRTSSIKGVLNFTGVELDLPERISVENVHIEDYLMMLCFDIRNNPANIKDQEEDR